MRYTLPSNKGEASILIADVSFIGALTGLKTFFYMFLTSSPAYILPLWLLNEQESRAI